MFKMQSHQQSGTLKRNGRKVQKSAATFLAKTDTPPGMTAKVKCDRDEVHNKLANKIFAL